LSVRLAAALCAYYTHFWL